MTYKPFRSVQEVIDTYGETRTLALLNKFAEQEVRKIRRLHEQRLLISIGRKIAKKNGVVDELSDERIDALLTTLNQL